MDIKAYEGELFNSLLNSFEKYNIGMYATSVILTGSFGRNEPTYAYDGDRFILKSDIEIGIVFKGRRNRKALEGILLKIAEQYEEDLNFMLISQCRVESIHNYNFSLLSPKYKTLFTYDLFNGSKTIWGREYLNKDVSLQSVDLYEAKRLVANRIGELTYLSITSDDKYLNEQWKGKILLAIAGAYLLCEQKYVSSYKCQRVIVQSDSDKISEIVGEKFVEDYLKAFSFLKENGKDFYLCDEKLLEYINNIDLYFKQKKLNKSKTNTISRMLKYFFKLIKNRRVVLWNFVNIEDRILQGLIDSITNTEAVKQYSILWFNVLY